jgi:hypothetical protein
VLSALDTIYSARIPATSVFLCLSILDKSRSYYVKKRVVLATLYNNHKKQDHQALSVIFLFYVKIDVIIVFIEGEKVKT